MTSQKPVKGRRDNSGQAVGNKDSDEEDSNIEDSAFDLSRDIRGFEKHLSEVEEEEVEEDEENEEDSFHENDLDDEEQDEVGATTLELLLVLIYLTPY
ncbi:hypothetical protein EON64_10785 [archaeon]|nr:MAG: hypothetical protein EON64_10785 [archaeon]